MNPRDEVEISAVVREIRRRRTVRTRDWLIFLASVALIVCIAIF